MRLNERLRHFVLDVHRQTPFLRLLVLLIALWLLFSSGMYLAERHDDGSCDARQGLLQGLHDFVTVHNKGTRHSRS